MTYFLNKCMFRFYFKNQYIKLFLNGEKIKTYTYKNCVFKSFVSYKEHLFLIWEKYLNQ